MIMSENPLIELLYGKGAHVSPLACVHDLSIELAGSTVSGFPHTVWQILKHLNYWMDYELARIDGHEVALAFSGAASWPAESKPVSKTEWHNEVLLFSERLQALVRLAQSSAAVPNRPPETSMSAGDQEANSVEAVLGQTVAHNSYHVGQIVLLRRSLNAWPPKAQGDCS